MHYYIPITVINHLPPFCFRSGHKQGFKWNCPQILDFPYKTLQGRLNGRYGLIYKVKQAEGRVSELFSEILFSKH